MRTLERSNPLPVAVSAQLKALAAQADRLGVSSPRNGQLPARLLRLPQPAEEGNRCACEKRRDLTWRKSGVRGRRMMSFHGN